MRLLLQRQSEKRHGARKGAGALLTCTIAPVAASMHTRPCLTSASRAQITLPPPIAPKMPPFTAQSAPLVVETCGRRNVLAAPRNLVQYSTVQYSAARAALGLAY